MQEISKLRLGIDYGRKKVGLAKSDSFLAEPFRVVRGNSMEELVNNVWGIIEKFKFLEIVVGVSDGEIAAESRIFGKKLELKSGVKVMFFDETLTTNDAKELAIAAGIKRKKRKHLEDAYAATLILQNYLDSL